MNPEKKYFMKYFSSSSTFQTLPTILNVLFIRILHELFQILRKIKSLWIW